MFYLEIMLPFPSVAVWSTSKVVKPGFLRPVMLDAVQVLLSVVEVVLKAAVTVVTVITFPHSLSNLKLNLGFSLVKVKSLYVSVNV